jgi:multiple sugar transport system substrate-binding protein
MKRRRLLIGAAGAMTAAACGAPSGHDRLRYWNLFGGGDGVRMVELIDAFAASRPDLDFQASTLAWGPPYYTKLSMAAAGGRAPDVAILHLARLSSFAPGRLLDPFPQELLTEAGITPDRFLPEIWDRCVVDGQVYAIPLDTHPFVMYYNTELCRQLGLSDANGDLIPLRGPDELVAAWSEAKRLTGGYGVVLDNFGVSPWRLWWTLYRQLDGDLLNADATALVIDDAKALQALDFMRRLSVTDAVAPGQMLLSGAVALFGSSKAAFLFNGEWEVTTFQTQQTPFSMVPFPEVFPGTSGPGGIARTQADCHTFVLPHQRDRTVAGTRPALDYVRFMLEHSVDWAAGGHVPAWLPATRSPEYLALDPQSRYRDAATTAQLDPKAWFSGSASNMENLAGAAFGTVQAGTSTPEAGLALFKADLQRLIDTPAPV